MIPIPRGVRNANPGNIRRSHRGPVWQGEVWPGGDISFCTFETAEHGIRAIAITLRTYVIRDACRTIGKAIERWAPPCENPTQNYVSFVLNRMPGTQAWSALDTSNYVVMRKLVAAIIAEECADYAYPDAVLDEGLRLAGLVVPHAAAPVAEAVA